MSTTTATTALVSNSANKVPPEIWGRVLGYLRPSDYPQLCKAHPLLSRYYFHNTTSVWLNRFRAYRYYVHPYRLRAPSMAKEEGESAVFMKALFEVLTMEMSREKCGYLLRLAVHQRHGETVRMLLRTAGKRMELWRMLNASLRADYLRYRPIDQTHQWLMQFDEYRELTAEQRSELIRTPSLLLTNNDEHHNNNNNNSDGQFKDINELTLAWVERNKAAIDHPTHQAFIQHTASRNQASLDQLIEDTYPRMVMVNGWDICLLYAVQSNDLTMARQLLNYGADPHVHRNDPIKTAVSANAVPMVRLLLEYGADMTDTMGSDRDASALLRAALLGNVDVMRVMVEEFGADLNSDDDDGEGARCLVSAVRNDHVPMASLLLFHGVSVRAVLNENDELVDAALNTLTNRERVGSVAMMNVLRRYSRRQRTP